MENEEEYNQDRKNLLKIVVDTGNDYPEYDNSSEDYTILSIYSSSNDMDVDEVSENPEDKRKSRSPSKKLSENYIDFLEEELESNSNLKNNAMVKLLKDIFGIEGSESTIRRALQEHEYHFIGPKICPKNTWKEQQKKIRLV